MHRVVNHSTGNGLWRLSLESDQTWLWQLFRHFKWRWKKEKKKPTKHTHPEHATYVLEEKQCISSVLNMEDFKLCVFQNATQLVHKHHFKPERDNVKKSRPYLLFGYSQVWK